MQYKVGDNVVHLSHGVGIITGIESRQFSQDKPVEEFLIIAIQDNNGIKKVFVPILSVNERLRGIISPKQVQVIFKILSSKVNEVSDFQTWNRRYREFMERIHTGDAEQIATVLKALQSIKNDRDLSFGERKLMDQAMSLLVKEFSIVLQVCECDVQRQIEQALGI